MSYHLDRPRLHSLQNKKVKLALCPYHVFFSEIRLKTKHLIYNISWHLKVHTDCSLLPICFHNALLIVSPYIESLHCELPYCLFNLSHWGLLGGYMYYLCHGMGKGTCDIVHWSAAPHNRIANRTVFWVYVVLVLNVIRYSCHYFLDRFIFHHDFHHDSCDYHWDFYGHWLPFDLYFRLPLHK